MSTPAEPTATGLAEALATPPEPESDETAELRRTNRRLIAQLSRAKLKGDDLRQALYEAANDALSSVGRAAPVKTPKGRAGGGRPEVALMHLTDWQAAKKTTTYNSAVLRRRIEAFQAKAAKITAIQGADHPVNDAVILLGGDMIEGLFNYPAQLAQIDATLFQQWAETSLLLGDFIRWALSTFQTVQVVAEWGNHGRIGSKRAEVPKNDNFDRMVYEHTRQMLAGEDRLTWGDCPDDVQQVEVGAYRALLIHGDEFGRNGFASPMTIVQHANRWRSGAYPWEFRDVYVGHYHTHAEWPMANGLGAVYQTGSTESDNRYARDGMSATATPSQRLHFVDPVKGRVTAQYKVMLDDA